MKGDEAMLINANVQGSVSPQAVWVRYMENGMAVVRFTQNVTTSKDANGNTVYGYEEIEVQVPDMPDLETYLTANTSFYWEQALAEAKAQQIAALGVALEAQYAQGFVSTALGNSLVFPFDAQSQIKWSWLQGVVNYTTATTFPSGIQVKDINGNIYTVTYTQAQQLVTDAMGFFLTWDGHYHTQMDSVNAAQTIPDAFAVGW